MKTARAWPWRGMALIAVTYFYFLIFAQFAFLELLRAGDLEPRALKLAMAAMGLGGVAGSLAVPLCLGRVGLNVLLKISLMGSAVVAVLATIRHSLAATVGIAMAIGISIGVLTVSVVSSLRSLLPGPRWGWQVGAATGLAYGLCNVPMIFLSPPRVQAWLAAGAALVLGIVWRGPATDEQAAVEQKSQWPAFLWIVLFFAILVWFDSAAFYMIQHRGGLKEETWGGAVMLWRNGCVHGLVALVAGGILSRSSRLLRGLLMGSFVVLGLATLMVEHEATRWWGGLFYPAGVSLYSVCLVAYPSFLLGLKNVRVVAWRAAVLYAVAGWTSSGLGIGMAENWHGIPWIWVAAAGLILVISHWVLCRPTDCRDKLRTLAKANRREIAVCSAVLVVAWMAVKHGAALDAEPAQGNASAMGRQVYLAEGCIHCHSQYVRPRSADELMWGPNHPYATLLEQTPPLLGNRRQGPDLLNVGNRRSRVWLRQHLLAPRSVSLGSVMPDYAHLFQDARGEALVDYLVELGREEMLQRYDQIQAWGGVPPSRETKSTQERGQHEFAIHCAACHGTCGDGNSPLRSAFVRPPTDLVSGPYVYVPVAMSGKARQELLARIIKFGLPGTDMPGHEFLADSEIEALTGFVGTLAGRAKSEAHRHENLNR